MHEAQIPELHPVLHEAMRAAATALHEAGETDPVKAAEGLVRGYLAALALLAAPMADPTTRSS